jgi:hypothetical protein
MAKAQRKNDNLSIDSYPKKNRDDKVEINALRKTISEKLKDPKFAKKAAQIIQELLKKG